MFSFLSSRSRRPATASQALSIRPTRRWWWRWWGGAVLLTGFLGALLAGLQLAGLDWLGSAQLRLDNRALRSALSSASASQQIALQQLAVQERTRREEAAARATLAQELAGLREENLHLKEDLAAMRSVMPGQGGTGVHISDFRVRSGGVPGEYRWSLLVAQGGRQSVDFIGRVHLRVEIPAAGGRTTQQIVEDLREPTPALSFKYYQEVEGVFRLPARVQPSRVWVDIWRDGQSRPVVSMASPLT